jgi:hypothetical protein
VDCFFLKKKLLSQLKVAAKNAHEEVMERYDRVKDDPRVAALECEKYFAQAHASHLHLLNLAEKEIDSWPGVNFFILKEKANQDMKVFQERFKVQIEYRNSLMLVERLIKKVGTNTKRTHTRQQKDIAGTMIAFDCPRALADTFAKIIQPRKGDERVQPFVSSPHSPWVDNHQSLIVARVVAPYDEKQTHWHDELQKFIKETDKVVGGKVAKGMQKMEKHDVANVMVALDARAFAFNPEGTTYFEYASTAKVPPLLYVQKAWAYCMDVDDVPTAGVGGFITVRHGYALVVIVNVEDIIEEKLDLSSISAFFEKRGSSALGKLATFGLPQNSSVFIPFGTVPVVIGVDLVDSETFDVVAYTFSPMLETKFFGTSASVRAEIQGALVKAIGRPNSVLSHKESKKTYQSWLASWNDAD